MHKGRAELQRVTSIKDWIALGVLFVFQVMFVGVALQQCSYGQWAQPKRVESISNGVQKIVFPAVAPISGAVVGCTLLLFIFAVLMMLLFRWTKVADGRIVVPLFLLLTIGEVFQWYCTCSTSGRLNKRKKLVGVILGNEQAAKHMLWIVVGLATFVVCFFLTKSLCNEMRWNRRLVVNFAVGCNFALAVILFAWTLYTFVRPTAKVNGSSAFVDLPGIPQFMPSELMKVSAVASAGFCSDRLEDALKRRLLWSYVACIFTMLISNDFGNLIIFMALLVILSYCLDAKLLGKLVGALSVGGILYTLSVKFLGLRFGGHIVSRITAMWTVLSDISVEANQRRALLGCIKSGVGGNLQERFYVTSNFAADTDYCFGVILSLFGVGIGLLLVLCFFALALQFSLRWEGSAEENRTVYYLSNGLICVLLLQAFVHIVSTMDILAFTGVVLPFVSRGGISMICCFMCLGISLGCRIDNKAWSSIEDKVIYPIIRCISSLIKRIPKPVKKLVEETG